MLHSPPRALPRPQKRHAAAGDGGGCGSGGTSKLWPSELSPFGLVAQESVDVAAMALRLQDAEARTAEMGRELKQLRRESHVWHRSVLDRERVAVLEHHRGRVPSELTLDMDFAENLELGEARPVRTIAWSSPLLELMSLLFVLRSKVSTGSPISPR